MNADKAEKEIRALMSLPENRRCADCTAKSTTAVNFTFNSKKLTKNS